MMDINKLAMSSRHELQDTIVSLTAENKKLREEKTELKNAYAETFEEYIPDEYLGEANEFLLSRFKDYEMSKAIVDRKQALENKE